SERGNHPVVRIPLRQWMLRITAYADRLEKDLDSLDWSESIKALQRNWIGRSTGAEVDFYLGDVGAFETWKRQRAKSAYPRKPDDDVLRIYTTRPDTLYGATYMVLAPEHPTVERLTTSDRAAEVAAYCQKAARKSDLDRTDLAKEKTGVFTGSCALNPVNGEPVPIWVADYVLMGYGTGAIMAVPAHDTRDFEFAVEYGLPIQAVVDPGDSAGMPRADVLAGKAAFTEHGLAIHSGPYDGLPTAEFKPKITADLAARGVAREAVNYKLRDWLFSRQHFWGEPFPILHELDAAGKPTGMIRAVRPDELPVNLPDMAHFKPHGRPDPPLEEAPHEWLYPVIDGVKYKRETNTMPQWAGSCWYYLRFLDPRNERAFVDSEVERAWMPVDIYIGGAEHAVLHLLYARFWHKVLFDRGLVSTPEPFERLVNQGMILGEIEFTGFQQADGRWVSAQHVAEDAEGKPVHKTTGEALRLVVIEPGAAEKQGEHFVLKADSSIRLESRAHKMSKSRGNVINPDEVVSEYGADSLRLFEMFMGPLEATKPWSMEGVNGVRGFLDRVWRMIVNERADSVELNASIQDIEPTAEQDRVLHRTIREVTQDIEKLSFNTAIAKMMEFTNFFLKCDPRPQRAMERLVLLLSPFAPHIGEELWRVLGHGDTLANGPWPGYDEAAIKQDTVEVPVQINGKVRGRVTVPADADQAALEAAAKADPKIAAQLDGKTLLKSIVVPGRMVNFVVK
ncbi:MAG TPA: leucine--tRNA ligase, partial [Pirellulales bacterium]|nr:leucine--tRNA ligase [Pirellulales bacterium]